MLYAEAIQGGPKIYYNFVCTLHKNSPRVEVDTNRKLVRTRHYQGVFFFLKTNYIIHNNIVGCWGL